MGDGAGNWVQTGMQLWGMFNQMQGQQQQGQAQADYNYYMAGELDKQAASIEKVGRQNMDSLKKNISRVDASQKTALAANGVYADSGTAQDISADTSTQAELDMMALKYKTEWDAYSARSQATGYRKAGANAVAAANIQATGTMIGGASQIAGNWDRWSRTGA